MIDQGVTVTVAAPGLDVDNQVRKDLESLGAIAVDISLQRTGTNPIRDFGSLRHLYRLMRSSRPDVVLGYTIKPVVFGSLAGWLARVPRRYALVTGLGYAFTGSRSGLLTVIIRRLYRLALGTVDLVFFQNPDDEAFLRQKGILPAATPSFIVNGSGIDLVRYPVEPLPKTPVNFLMIARLLGDKGTREYVKAARQVRSRHPEIRCSLVGWIDDNPDAISQSELDAWVEKGYVEYQGRLQDVRPAIADCSVYVLPSYREGTPRTVLEAMAMGRAIITSNAPGCRETVIDGQNGFLVPVRSAEELADAMCRFVEDPELTIHMGRRSREIAEEKFDVRKVNAQMLHEMGIGN
ncbi:MAG: glycosyltransferase family 4 protein [Woeseiaceae bacterium]